MIPILLSLFSGTASVSHCRDSNELIGKIQEHLPAAESSCKDIQTIEGIHEEVAIVNDSPQIQISWMPLKPFLSLEIESEAALTKTCP
ncbi:hypothetical protein QL285_023383 [Trifolium repens]|nr:hypothetical protein QL285_023383 [Trifolium repens]